MGYSGIGDAIEGLFKALIISAVVAWPLAIWKLIDIGIWVFSHVKVGIQ